jgi:anti-anti-sigma factor
MTMFTIEDQGGGTYRLTGRLDAAQVETAEATLADASGAVTLDLSELDYIASAGISVVLSLFKRLHASGDTLKLASPTPHVFNVFRYAGLDQVLDIDSP